MKGQALKGHLDLLVLGVLADRPKHGYAVIDELRVRSGLVPLGRWLRSEDVVLVGDPVPTR